MKHYQKSDITVKDDRTYRPSSKEAVDWAHHCFAIARNPNTPDNIAAANCRVANIQFLRSRMYSLDRSSRSRAQRTIENLASQQPIAYISPMETPMGLYLEDKIEQMKQEASCSHTATENSFREK